MRLTVKDRVIFIGLFAANIDSQTEAAVQRSIRKVIEISQSEVKEIDLQPTGNGFIWDPKKAKEIDFKFTPEQLIYIKTSVYNLSKSPTHSVTQDILPLCEKIWQ